MVLLHLKIFSGRFQCCGTPEICLAFAMSVMCVVTNPEFHHYSICETGPGWSQVWFVTWFLTLLAFCLLNFFSPKKEDFGSYCKNQ